MLSQVKTLLPASFEPVALKAWYIGQPLVRVAFSGQSRYCCVCDSWSRGFGPDGPPSRRRDDVVCPVCRSHDRHRLAWLYITSRTNLTDDSPKKLLHFAPEPVFIRAFKKLRSIDYLSADINSPLAMVKMDISKMDLPDSAFDAIYCSHVLEHVPEDIRAMSEMFRVLKPGGWALVQVPTSKNDTIEDLSITDPAERERLYWQDDHVRLYGMDIKDRLASVGFDVEVLFGREVAGPEECEKMGIRGKEPLFCCTKPMN